MSRKGMKGWSGRSDEGRGVDGDDGKGVDGR